MTTKMHVSIAGFTLAAMLGLIYVSATTHAAEAGEDLPAVVKKIAGHIKNKKYDEAKKLAAATAKNVKLIDEVSDLMHMYRPVEKGGLGIEDALKKANAKNANDLGNQVRAMADLTIARGFDKYTGKRSKKAWNDTTEDMRAAAEDLAKANTDKAAKAAAEKVTAACNRCHSIFKD